MVQSDEVMRLRSFLFEMPCLEIRLNGERWILLCASLRYELTTTGKLFKQ